MSCGYLSIPQPPTQTTSYHVRHSLATTITSNNQKAIATLTVSEIAPRPRGGSGEKKRAKEGRKVDLGTQNSDTCHPYWSVNADILIGLVPDQSEHINQLAGDRLSVCGGSGC